LSRDTADGERYTFPDDSFLLMIGNTKELEDACRDAYNAGIRRIETQSRRKLGLGYVRMEVFWVSGQIDTLIALGAKGRLPDSSAEGWREHKRPWGGDYVLTADDHTHAHWLPPVIRGIKEFFGEACHTVPLGPPLKQRDKGVLWEAWHTGPLGPPRASGLKSPRDHPRESPVVGSVSRALRTMSESDLDVHMTAAPPRPASGFPEGTAETLRCADLERASRRSPTRFARGDDRHRHTKDPRFVVR
jgi:hypothetical protein